MPRDAAIIIYFIDLEININSSYRYNIFNMYKLINPTSCFLMIHALSLFKSKVVKPGIVIIWVWSNFFFVFFSSSIHYRVLNPLSESDREKNEKNERERMNRKEIKGKEKRGKEMEGKERERKGSRGKM